MQRSAVVVALLCCCGLQALEPGTVIAVPEGGFEEGGTQWTLPAGGLGEVVEDPVGSGRHALRIVDPSAQAGSNVTSARIPMASPGLYRIRGRLLPMSGNGLGIYVRIFDDGGACISGESHVLGLGGESNHWEPFEAEFMASSRARSCEIWIHSYQQSVVTALLDDLALLYVSGPNPAMEKDMDTIKARLRERVRGTTPQPEAVATTLRTQQEDGRWSDIDYMDRNSASWKPSGHMGRMLTLAHAYAAEDTPATQRDVFAEALGRALDYWCREDFICPNWWYNQIGVPRQLYRIMLLIEPTLTPARMQAGLKILERAKLGMTGQNLVWVAEVTIARGCLAGDASLLWDAFRRIADEITVTNGEGIQPDWSFYQHGTQLYSGGYGLGFSVDCPSFASLAAGTAFAFSPDKTAILSHYILDGQQWMVRGKRFDYSACGREISRRGAARATSLTTAARYMMEVDPERAAEHEVLAERISHGVSEKAPALGGNRYFWRSDFGVHHREKWYTSVRVTSPRMVQTETCNDENLLGALLSDGVNYLFMDGNEYDGIFPVWDWKRLPGITVELDGESPLTRNGARGKHTFAGGVSDGQYGCTAMMLERGGLQARKAWFLLDGGYVCLGAGISCTGDHGVITSVTQCRQQGSVVHAGTVGLEALQSGRCPVPSGSWVHHNRVGYLILEGDDAVAVAEPQSGSWHTINRVYPDKEETQDVFSLWIDHGATPRAATYAYAVLPAKDVEAVVAANRAFNVDILANDPACQAVRDTVTGTIQAVFYDAPGEGARPEIDGLPRVDRPCLLQLVPTAAGVRLAVCSPSGEDGPLTVTLVGNYKGQGDADIRSVAGVTTVRLVLPEGNQAGATVQTALLSLK